MRLGVMFLRRGGRGEAGRLTPSGSESISRRDPWAAGTQTVPLPTAIQGSPLRGLRTGSGPISTPSVSSQRCGICSAPVEREEGRRGDRVRGFSQQRRSVPFERQPPKCLRIWVYLDLLQATYFSYTYPDTRNAEAIRPLFSASYRDSWNGTEKR